MFFKCFFFFTVDVNWHQADIGWRLADLDTAVCHENVGKEANLILSCASTSPLWSSRQSRQGGGKGNEEVGGGLTQNQLR